MKKLKYMSMMGLVVLLLIIWVVCFDDMDVLGGENLEEVRVYIIVIIVVLNGVVEIRVFDLMVDIDDMNMDIGLKDEYKVMKVNLYLFLGGVLSSFGIVILIEIIFISQFM